MSLTVVTKNMLPLRAIRVGVPFSPLQYSATTTRQRNIHCTPWASGFAYLLSAEYNVSLGKFAPFPYLKDYSCHSRSNWRVAIWLYFYPIDWYCFCYIIWYRLVALLEVPFARASKHLYHERTEQAITDTSSSLLVYCPPLFYAHVYYFPVHFLVLSTVTASQCCQQLSTLYVDCYYQDEVRQYKSYSPIMTTRQNWWLYTYIGFGVWVLCNCVHICYL